MNRVEAENIASAMSKYLLKPVNTPLNWFNVNQLKKIHYDMFFDVWDWAGSFRTTQTSPGIEPYQILMALEQLCQDVSYWCSQDCGLTIVDQAARIHHRLVYIHPYPNGNGRFSRLVSDRYLKSWKCSFPKWPIGIGKNGSTRKNYIRALQRADLGEYDDLISYMKKYGAKNN